MKLTTPLFVLAVLSLNACTPSQPGPLAPDPVNVTVLGLNDFHGNLEPTSFTLTDKTVIKGGGVEAIGGMIAKVKASNPNTVLVGGGDLIGASPTTSSLLRDEPSIISLSKLGMVASALGNHEFDQGLSEILRMQYGGCNSNAADKACKFQDPYPRSGFQYLAANVVYKGSSQTAFPPYLVATVGGAKIAFIGAVTKTTPSIVSPSGVAQLDFLDEATSINKYVPELKAQNVDAMIVLIHEGGTTTAEPYDKVGCSTLAGPIVNIANAVDPAVTAIISGHSHQGYNCLVNGRIIIQGDFYGHLLQRLDLKVDKANHKVLEAKAANVVINYDDPTLTKDADQTALVAKAKTLTQAISNQPVATLAVSQIKRGINNDRNSESALGDVIADAQLEATKTNGAQIAFMNPGGIRNDLPDTKSIRPDNSITFGDVFTVQPFGNTLTVMNLTGAQIKTLLEQQFSGGNAGTGNKLLQVSNGFSYSYDSTAADGARVDASSIKLNGVTLDPATKYRVVVNSFLADGGDNFLVLKDGTERVARPDLVDVDALVNYLKANASKLDGKVQNRITKTK